MEIPQDVHEKIMTLCASGDERVEGGDFDGAYRAYMDALQMVPAPRQTFEATTWIMAALGDMYFQTADYAQARQVLTDAMHCVGAIGNPFLHLRLGQVQLELGNEERAADELCRAYMGAGKEIFEQEDQRYFDFLKTRIAPPADGVW